MPKSKVSKINKIIKDYFAGAKDRFRKAAKRKNDKGVSNEDLPTTSEMGSKTGNSQVGSEALNTSSSDLFD